MTEEKPKTKVLIGVAMRRFRDAEDTPMHLRMLMGELRTRKLPWTFDMMVYGGGNVARARNKITADFLRGDWKWVSWLDDDIGEEDDPAIAARNLADALIQILSHRLHVCGALYTTKDKEGPHWVLNTFREPEIDEKGLLRVPELGTGGFKTYHRTVFETLVKKEPDLAYFCDETANPEWGFFCMGLMDDDGKRRWLPEDFWLDQLCRKHGIPVHVDTTIKLRHRGPDGVMYPIDDEWPRMPGPTKETPAPPTVEDMPVLYKVEPGAFVIMLQYWEGDRIAAQRLARFMADLEQEFRHGVEICLVRRHDAADFDSDVEEHVRKKFTVTKLVTPEHVPGYPISPNTMAINAIRAAGEWWRGARGFMLMESDCIPVARDWIEQLIIEWSRARTQGALLMGSWRPECTPVGHLNGNLCFHGTLAEVLKGAEIPKKAWDIALVPLFEAHWCRTGLISNRYREIILTDERIAMPECGTKPPVAVHGAKDRSVVAYAERMTGVKFS